MLVAISGFRGYFNSRFYLLRMVMYCMYILRNVVYIIYNIQDYSVVFCSSLTVSKKKSLNQTALFSHAVLARTSSFNLPTFSKLRHLPRNGHELAFLQAQWNGYHPHSPRIVCQSTSLDPNQPWILKISRIRSRQRIRKENVHAPASAQFSIRSQREGDNDWRGDFRDLCWLVMGFLSIQVDQAVTFLCFYPLLGGHLTFQRVVFSPFQKGIGC